MKIYLLLMLIGIFVAFSYLPIRSEAKQVSKTPSDSVPA
jgi:preprotein translocase subunit YajC